MNIIITLVILLLIFYLTTLLAKKIKLPVVVALIISGLILGFPIIKKVIIGPNEQFIFNLGDLALLCLMFLAGLESSWKSIHREEKDAFFIALFSSSVSFLLGFVVFMLLGFSLLISLIVGICMSITAEATRARVLLELKKLRTKVGAAMMGAGIIDDIFGLTLFVLVTSLLGVSYLKENLLIIGAIVFFFIGILIEKHIGRSHSLIKNIEKAMLILIIPFFFVSMGIHFDISSLLINPFIILIIIAVAIIGKLVGAFLVKPFTKFNWRQLHLIGWGMNSRGAIELALALIAFRNNLIPIEIYSGLVIMAIITTLIFPFVIIRMIKKDPKLMN